jgi:hypothetical protein
MNRTIDIAQAALARRTLAAYPPDVLVEVPRSACRSLDFHCAAESSTSVARWPLPFSMNSKSQRRKADSGAEEIGDRGGHPPALVAAGQCGRLAARGVERVAPEGGE